jgi:hypothetical protein
MFPDLLLNLVAEGIGIIATYFIIDRIIKNREEKRWKPSKDIVHSQLITLMSRLLQFMYPLREDGNFKVPGFRFGETTVILFDTRGKGRTKSQRYTDIKANFANQQIIDLTSLEKVSDDINNRLVASSFLMEPELLKLVQKLSGQLDSFIGFQQKSPTILAERFNCYYLLDIEDSATEILNWLTTKADKYQEHLEYADGKLITPI